MGNINNLSSSDEIQQKENTFYIAVILFGAVIVIILNIITIFLFINYAKDENWEITSENTNVVTNEIIDHLNTSISSGQYEAVIQMILDTGLDEAAGADYLQKAIDELYLQCVNEASALAADNDYDTALAMIDGRI